MTEFPRFSDAEYARRHAALGGVMERAEVDHLLIVTDHRAGNAPQWVTGWPGTVEAYVVFEPGEPMVMHVEWFNHVPLARRIARGVDVRWGEHRGVGKTIEELKPRRKARWSYRTARRPSATRSRRSSTSCCSMASTSVCAW